MVSFCCLGHLDSKTGDLCQGCAMIWWQALVSLVKQQHQQQHPDLKRGVLFFYHYSICQRLWGLGPGLLLLSRQLHGAHHLDLRSAYVCVPSLSGSSCTCTTSGNCNWIGGSGQVARKRQRQSEWGEFRNGRIPYNVLEHSTPQSETKARSLWKVCSTWMD